jgi:hypothetical protein
MVAKVPCAHITDLLKNQSIRITRMDTPTNLRFLLAFELPSMSLRTAGHIKFEGEDCKYIEEATAIIEKVSWAWSRASHEYSHHRGTVRGIVTAHTVAIMRQSGSSPECPIPIEIWLMIFTFFTH